MTFPPETCVAGILLAAGRSQRMRGQDKLLRSIKGESLLRRSVKMLMASRVSQVIVVIGHGAIHHRSQIDDLDVVIVEVDDAEHAMSASIRAGVTSVPADAKGILIALADMPDVTATHINQLVDAHHSAPLNHIICPIAPCGTQGNPVLFSAAYREKLLALTGDKGAKSILRDSDALVVKVPMDTSVLCDLDTPEAWSVWEERTTKLLK